MLNVHACVLSVCCTSRPKLFRFHGIGYAWLCCGALLIANVFADRAVPSPAAAAVTPPRIAVLDFTMAEGKAGEDWAIGAAELVEVELMQRGVEVLERRQIRLILGERQLLHGGLIARDTLAAEGLPYANSHVTGTITKTGDKSFRLTARLESVQHGVEQRSFTAEGRFPDDWAKILSTAAERLTVDLPVGGASQVMPGAGKVPEAVPSFYQGLACFASGRIEEAWICFHRAYMADDTFLLARAWEMRALDTCGLPEYAAVLRDNLIERQGGALVAAMAAGSRLKAIGQPVWTMQADSGVPPVLALALQDCLHKQGSVQFFRPERLTALAREADLQVSGEMAAQGMPGPAAWMSAEALLKLRCSATMTGRVDVLVQDIASGQLLAAQEVVLAELGDGNHVTALANDLLASLKRTAPAPSEPSVRSPSSMPDVQPPANNLARALWQYRRTPDDLAAAWDWAHALRDCGDWNWITGRNCLIAINHLQQLLDTEAGRQQPDAALWLNATLFARYTTEALAKCVYGQRVEPTAPLAEVYGPLLARYPVSPAASVARYAIAQDLILQAKHAEAVALLEQVRKAMTEGASANPEPGVPSFPRKFLPHTLYFLASEQAATGNLTAAIETAQSAVDGLQRQQAEPGADAPSTPVGAVLPVLVPNLNRSAKTVFWNIQYQDEMVARFRERAAARLDIGAEIPALLKRLKAGATNPDALTVVPIPELVDRAKAGTGPAAFTLHAQAVEQTIAQMTDKLPPKTEFFSELAWLYLQASSPEDQARLAAVTARATAKLKAPDERYLLFAAAGDLPAANDALQKMLAAPPAAERLDAILAGVAFHTLTNSSAAGREFLQRECDRLLREVRTAKNRHVAINLPPQTGQALLHALLRASLPVPLSAMVKERLFPQPEPERRAWSGVAAQLAGDHFQASEECRAILSATDGTGQMFVPGKVLAMQLLRQLRVYADFNDLAAAAPVTATVIDPAVGIRALRLHVEALERGLNFSPYWRQQGQRQLAQTGATAMKVWVRLLENQALDSCRCYTVFVGIQPPARTDTADVVAVLLRLAVTQTGETGVPGNAVAALGYLGPAAAEAVPLLIAATGDVTRHNDGNARWALGQVGTAPPRCLPRLAKLLKHPDAKVQQRAVKAFIATAGTRLPPDMLKDVPVEQQPENLLKWWDATGAQLAW